MPSYDPDALPAELREHATSTPTNGSRRDDRMMSRFFGNRAMLRVIALVVVAAMFLVPLLVSLASLVTR